MRENKSMGWYYPEMSDKSLTGILSKNVFQAGEIEVIYSKIKDRIKKLNLKLYPLFTWENVEYSREGKKYLNKVWSFK
jgi:hypothetical protein